MLNCSFKQVDSCNSNVDSCNNNKKNCKKHQAFNKCMQSPSNNFLCEIIPVVNSFFHICTEEVLFLFLDLVFLWFFFCIERLPKTSLSQRCTTSACKLSYQNLDVNLPFLSLTASPLRSFTNARLHLYMNMFMTENTLNKELEFITWHYSS